MNICVNFTDSKGSFVEHFLDMSLLTKAHVDHLVSTVAQQDYIVLQLWADGGNTVEYRSPNPGISIL